jgi:hypothetical protein
MYRFEGMAKAEDIKPVQTGRGTGAGVRISREARANKLVGTSDWSKISHDFEVANQSDVQMVLELYANGGQIVFDTSTLKLRRL